MIRKDHLLLDLFLCAPALPFMLVFAFLGLWDEVML